MRQRNAEPVHAFGAVGRETRVVLADPPRVPHHLWEIEVPPPAIVLVLAQDPRDVRARRVPPDGVRRDDGVGRPLIDRVGQRQRQAAFRNFDVVRADIGHALGVVAEAEAPLRLDRAGRGIVDQVDDPLALALGYLGERRLRAPRPFPRRRPGRTTCRTGRHSRRWAPAALSSAGAAAHKPTKRVSRRPRAGSQDTSDWVHATVAHGAVVFQPTHGPPGPLLLMFLSPDRGREEDEGVSARFGR